MAPLPGGNSKRRGALRAIIIRLRRNIVVSGINLVALRHRKIRLGTAIVKGTELCPPCSRMEAALGEGGYNAMRGHGGICTAVIEVGKISVGDAVEPA